MLIGGSMRSMPMQPASDGDAHLASWRPEGPDPLVVFFMTWTSWRCARAARICSSDASRRLPRAYTQS